MKKSVLFLLFLINISVNAQKYVPFATDNTNWNVRFTYSPEDFPQVLETTLLKYTLNGDTIIGDELYKKVCLINGTPENPVYIGVGGLRELNKQIFYVGLGYLADANTLNQQRIRRITDCRFSTESSNANEVLLYDFNVKEGDEIWWGYLGDVIEKVDSVLIGLTYRKSYRLKYSKELIIEGIGNVNRGLFGWITSVPMCGGSWSWEHICYSQNGETLYLNPAFVDCNSTQKWADKKYLDGNPIWTINAQECVFCNESKMQYSFSGDTILNSKTYRKVLQRSPTGLQASYFGAIREEGGKIYANMKRPEFGNFGEILLYDFTLKVGDTTKLSMPDFGSELSVARVVTKIDTVQLLNGEKRKQFNFDGIPGWIEGIGSTSGLFAQMYTISTSELRPELLCFKNSNAELYKSPYSCSTGNCCDLLAGNTNVPAAMNRCIILPNPTKDVIKLKFTNPNEHCISIQFTDFMGKQLQTSSVADKQELNIDLSALTSGVYFLILRYSDTSELHKIIKL